MATLILLIASWLVFLGLGTLLKNITLKQNAGAWAMAALMVFTGVFHFIYVKGMMLMIPEVIPYKLEMVYFTGVLEILAGTGLLLPRSRKLTGILLILFFISITPANIIAASRHVKLSTGTLDGPGLEYLWFRIPLQILFIGWTWYFCVREKRFEVDGKNN